MLPCNFLKTKLKACIFKKCSHVQAALPASLHDGDGKNRVHSACRHLEPWLAASAVSSTSLGFWILGWCFATAAMVLPSKALFVPLALSVKFILLTFLRISLKR